MFLKIYVLADQRTNCVFVTRYAAFCLNPLLSGYVYRKLKFSLIPTMGLLPPSWKLERSRNKTLVAAWVQTSEGMSRDLLWGPADQPTSSDLTRQKFPPLCVQLSGLQSLKLSARYPQVFVDGTRKKWAGFSSLPLLSARKRVNCSRRDSCSLWCLPRQKIRCNMIWLCQSSMVNYGK